MNGVRKFSINKKNSNWLKISIGAVAFLFFVYILSIFSLPVKNYFYSISAPLQETVWSAGESSSAFLGSLINAGSIFKENENLKKENQNLLAEIVFLQSKVEATQTRSSALENYKDSGFKLVMTGVIGLDDDDMLSINRGSANGISEGMPVINQNNVLFGKVFKVYENFSKVMLISNKNSIVNVKIQKNTEEGVQEVDGVVKGNGGLQAFLDLIPINNEIDPMDILVTSAIDKSFPKDLLVARIIELQKDDQKPFQQAKINLFLDIKATDNLFVISNYKQKN